MKNFENIANKKTISRKIVKEIEAFGVSEDQKIDIIYFLSMTLQDNNKMKEICDFLKKYKNNINIDENENNIVNVTENKNKLILE